LFARSQRSRSGYHRSQDGAAPPSPAGKSAEDIKAIKERVAEWLKTCLTDWDRATHMTTKEWRVTCQRVASERGKFLLETPNAMVDRHQGSAALRA
jgi:hypothetical protein